MKTWEFYDARQKDMEIGFKNNLHPALIVDVHITMWIMIWLFNYMISNSLGSKLKKKCRLQQSQISLHVDQNQKDKGMRISK